MRTKDLGYVGSGSKASKGRKETGMHATDGNVMHVALLPCCENWEF